MVSAAAHIGAETLSLFIRHLSFVCLWKKDKLRARRARMKAQPANGVGTDVVSIGYELYFCFGAELHCAVLPAGGPVDGQCLRAPIAILEAPFFFVADFTLLIVRRWRSAPERKREPDDFVRIAIPLFHVTQSRFTRMRYALVVRKNRCPLFRITLVTNPSSNYLATLLMQVGSTSAVSVSLRSRWRD
jgi:hypothetical protein